MRVPPTETGRKYGRLVTWRQPVSASQHHSYTLRHRGAQQAVRRVKEAVTMDDGGIQNGTSPRSERAFDPAPLVERLRAGGLDTSQEVDLLLLWMRKEHPQAKILTDL